MRFKKQFLLLNAILLFVLTEKTNGQITVFGNHLEFKSVNEDFVQIPDNASLDINASTGFTIQFWLNPKSLDVNPNAFQGLVTKKTAGGIGYGVFWDVTSGGVGRIQLALKETGAGGGSSKTISLDTNISGEGWLHITAVFQRGSPNDSAFIYLNGQKLEKDGFNTIQDLTNSQDVFLFNYAGGATTNTPSGSLDDVRIWNIALSEKQIQRFYAEPISEITTGLLTGKVQGAASGKRSFLLNWNNLVGYWPMEDPPFGNTISDFSLNANTGNFYSGAIACAGAPCGPDIVSTISAAPTSFIAQNSGLWSDVNTWGGNAPPNSDRSIVFINAGVTVTLDGTYMCESITIKSGGTLTAQPASVLQVTKYFDVDGVLDCKTNGNILFDQNGDHKIFGEGRLDFFDFELYQNSQIQVETELGSPVNIYGILLVGDGRIRTGDNMVLRVNKANSSRPYGLISPVGVGAPDIRGTLKMDKVLSSSNYGWRQMCMPLKGQLSDFTGMTLFDNTALASNQNVFFWDNASNPLVPANNVGWTSAPMGIGQGKPFSVYLGDPAFSFSDTITFEGDYNWGDTTYVLTYFNDPGNGVTIGNAGYENGVGWNFIPNRYPSLLDVQQMIADNPLAYKNIHIWDANTQQYMAFTANNNDYIVPYNNSGTTTAELAGAAIEPMQGFWVKTESGENGATFDVKDTWRSVNFGLNPHQSLKNGSRFQINVFAEVDSAWDGVAASLEQNATEYFNGTRDVYKKLSNGDVPSLFLEKDSRFIQNGVFPKDVSRIKMHFKASPKNKNGLYFLHLQAPVEKGKAIVVEDLATKSRHNLSQANYHFYAGNYPSSNRFIIHYVNEKDAQPEVLNANTITAYNTLDEIILQSAFVSGPATIHITDMSGRVLLHKNINLDVENRFAAPQTNGVVVLKIQHINGMEIIKMTLTQ